jgi:phage terminase large subunit-like protein
MGATIVEEDFARELDAARRKGPGPWRNFKRLRLGIWGESAEHFMDLGSWEACGSSELALPERGQSCYGGLDLASTEDLAAYALVFPTEDDDGEAVLDVLMRFWIPEETAERVELQRGTPYRAWQEAGWITLTPGARIDYRLIRKEIVRLHGIWPLAFGYSDPHNATHLVGDFLRDEDGLPFEFLSQGTFSLNAPTKELERIITGRRLRHRNDPVLNWCIGNAVAVKDRLMNVRLDKQKSADKIDGAVALVNAVAAWISAPDQDEEVIEYSGGLEL